MTGVVLEIWGQTPNSERELRAARRAGKRIAIAAAAAWWKRIAELWDRLIHFHKAIRRAAS